MRWTEQQYQEHMAKARPSWLGVCGEDTTAADPGPESVLSGKIVRWAKERGYPCQCFRQSRKARGFLAPGWPD